jgi:carboxyl-terminal processing protease
VTLASDRLDRFARHTVVPEIGGAGKVGLSGTGSPTLRAQPSAPAQKLIRSSAKKGGGHMMKAIRIGAALAAAVLLGGAGDAPDYPAAAHTLDATIALAYAYPEKLPGGELPRSAKLDAERGAVTDGRSLLHYAEDRVTSLADHHAITGSSFKDSWAVIPTYADLWIVARDGRYLVDAVREDSPAAQAGVHAGDLLARVDDVETGAAVTAFWDALGLAVTPRRADYAARVLAAGRRDRDRHLTITTAGGATRTLTLPSLYTLQSDSPPLTVSSARNQTVIRFNNSLGDDGTIAAFDATMAQVPPGDRLVLDLRDTPSGGNTTIARAVMGWFVRQAHGYQVHNRPVEQRQSGIARQWIEQVLPREGKHRPRLPAVWVGRWTGSMGEGLAIGFASMGATVSGTPMAGLNGSVEDLPVGDSGLTIKLPTERLMTTAGLPREDFVPRPLR